jgi:glycosyltransferase involved in cell wall biosynthesis
MFSIIIPTWNNLEYLKLCVKSIQKNSFYQHQIILHINDGSDGSLDWARENNTEHTHTASNTGICFAVNQAAILAKNKYIVYMNDDMYVCPDWDKYLVDEINDLGTDCFMLSATMIEPKPTSNKCVLVKNFGTSTETFDEKRLLKEYAIAEKPDWNGSTWPPTVVSRYYWFLTGGYSIELTPGMSSDDDFAMKMWKSGCRIFKGIGKSRVYHFQTRSTSRVKKNDGRRQFLFKWGINQSTFHKYFIRRGTPYSGTLMQPSQNELRPGLLRAWLKMKIKSIRWSD